MKPALLLMNGSLRLADHGALAAAVKASKPIIPVFVLEEGMGRASKWWLLHSLKSLAASFEKLGSRLILRMGERAEVLKALAEETGAETLYFTRGYSAADRAFEESLQAWPETSEMVRKRYGGRLLLEPKDVLNGSGTPYSVFSPFWKQAKALISVSSILPAPKALISPDTWPKSDSLETLNLAPKPAFWAESIADFWQPGEANALARLDYFISEIMMGYQNDRDVPGIDGTSKLSPYLAFGEISPRQIWHRAAQEMSEKSDNAAPIHAFLRELGWRDFSYHLLFRYPDMPSAPLKKKFDAFPWSSGESERLTLWQKGLTGFPIVDAGMRQLWQTGWMHNRVRMIVGSFLVKDLLWHWRDGAEWFWDTLVDADLANNTASWQWVAGCGADAAPYFRIFNPILQGEKFDPKGTYIRTYVPELAALPNQYIQRPFEAPAAVLQEAGITLGVTYPKPVVDRSVARSRALAALKSL